MSAVAISLPVVQRIASQVELLKWVGFVAMVADHLNKALFAGELVGFSEFGRLAFPLFTVALAIGLRGADDEKIKLVIGRLCLFGFIAQPLSMLLWPTFSFNILFTLALGVAASLLYRSVNPWVKFGSFFGAAVASLACEFFVPGFFFVFAAIYAFREPSPEGSITLLVTLALLYVPNGNHWALLAVPVVYGCAAVNLSLPRWRQVFYPLYPMHLAIIIGVAFVIGRHLPGL